MSELREVIARVIDPEAFGVPDPIAPEIAKWGYLTDRDEARARADAALRALSEAGRTYEQGVKDGGRQDIYWNAQQRRLEELEAQLAQAREALEWIADGTGVGRNPQVMAAHARTTLAALTAGSTEGKDG